MIYIVIAAVLGYAAWQLIRLFRRPRSGGCAAGCAQCDGCALGQKTAKGKINSAQTFVRLEEIPFDSGRRK